jgi:hypothetical protein
MLAPSRKHIAALAAALGVAAAGCGGTNPPCPIDVTEVDAVRRSAVTAERELEALNARRDQLENDIAAAEARREELERRKSELEAEIAAAGGGR